MSALFGGLISKKQPGQMAFVAVLSSLPRKEAAKIAQELSKVHFAIDHDPKLNDARMDDARKFVSAALNALEE